MVVMGIFLLFSRSFIILPFTFRFTVHLKLVFVCGVKKFHFFFPVDDCLSQHHLLKRLSFSTDTFVISQVLVPI